LVTDVQRLGEISDARPAQPLDALSYLHTSAPADQHATIFFFLSRAFRPMRLPAVVGSSTASSALEEAAAGGEVRAGGGGRRELRCELPPEEVATGSSAASRALPPTAQPLPRLTRWSSPTCGRIPGRRELLHGAREEGGGDDDLHGAHSREASIRPAGISTGGGTWREGELSTASGAPRSSAMCAGGARGARDRVCGACCKRMSHVFQMSHKDVARVSCECCKSRSRFFNIADVDPQHKRLIPDVATICFRMLLMLQLLVTYF
jgi:hypothetical protein